ncbi:MAG: sulfurtransferase, partial [Actinobacteria bacterium]|nr:sulfurtransferase [Actinomycetota bacterium]
RAADRYAGREEPIDPRAGHVPSARSLPTTGNLDGEGRFLPPAILRERLAAVGATGDKPIGTYCGSGITASHELFALALAGIDGALFPGSWSQWSNHPELPVATGETP